jgi:hypothetical protein
MTPERKDIPWQELSPAERVRLTHDVEFAEAEDPQSLIVVDTNAEKARIHAVIPLWDESWFAP